MPELPKVYVSECCGGVFVQAHGPDDIHEVDPFDELTVEWCPDLDGDPVRNADPDAPPRMWWERKIRIPREVAEENDAIRAGACPSCGEVAPRLNLLADGGGFL